MNEFMQKYKKILTVALFAIAAVFIVGGILLLALAVPAAGSTLFKILIALIAILSILIGVGALFILYLSRDTDPNFFLYDTKSCTNIDPSELDFDRINSRMTYFMSTLTTSQERLWSENVLGVNPERFGIHEVYRPLAAYKMLYDLCEIDRPEGWQLFLCASPASIDSLIKALQANGEEDMPGKLRAAYNNATGRDDIEWIRDYVMGNAKYIRGKMTAYVQKNMEWFY